MDFWAKAAESVRLQADKAAVQARALAQQVSDHTKVLAEQASTSAAAAAEQASAKLKTLQIQESLNAGVNSLGSATTAAAEQATARLQTLKLPDSVNTGMATFNATLTNTLNRVAAPGGGPSTGEPEPTAEELAEFGITPDFRDFVRSLTYSTFRDFPAEDIVQVAPTEEGKYLTPWQERHCLLVVKSLKEINELRYVLCPKRMTDEEFWKVYFTLAKKYLPEEAWDVDFVPLPAAPAGSSQPALPFSVGGFQKQLSQLGSTARQWSTQKGASILTAAQAALPTISLSNAGFEEDEESVGWRGGGSRGDAGAVGIGGRARGSGASGSASDGELVHVPEMDADPDLEAFLKDADRDDGKSEARTDGADGTEDSGEDDFDKYLNELNDGDGGTTEDGDDAEGEELDLDDYMKDLGDDDDEDDETEEKE